MKPFASVIIPVWNAAPFLRLAVESVLRQGCNSLEIVLVNDGSTDNSDIIARELARKHRKIVLIEQENRGVSAARNMGLRVARGEMICFLDADDELADDALPFFKRELETLRRESGDFVMVRGLVQTLRRGADETWPKDAFPAALSVVTASAQTRATMDKVGDFDEELSGPEDLDWLLRAQEARIVMPLFERVALLYRRHDANMTLDTAAMRANKEKMLRKCLARRQLKRRINSEKELAR